MLWINKLLFTVWGMLENKRFVLYIIKSLVPFSDALLSILRALFFSNGFIEESNLCEYLKYVLVGF